MTQTELNQWFATDGFAIAHSIMHKYSKSIGAHHIEFDDAMQIMCMYASEKANLYDPTEVNVLFSTWMYNMMEQGLNLEFRYLDALKRSDYTQIIPIGVNNIEYEIIGNGGSIPAFEIDIEKSIDIMEIHKLIGHSSSILSSEQKALVKLYYFDGLSQSEIAKKWFDCSQAKICSMLKDICKILANYFQEYSSF